MTRFYYKISQLLTSSALEIFVPKGVGLTRIFVQEYIFSVDLSFTTNNILRVTGSTFLTTDDDDNDLECSEVYKESRNR